MTAPRQLALDLALRPALGREDFLVAPSNAAAVAMIDQWPDWPAPTALLVGPAGSGKSHLVEVWRQLSGARRLQAEDLDSGVIPAALAGGVLALEDVGVGNFDETALFHLLNQVRSDGGSLLMTSTSHATGWDVKLPDLASRLKTVVVAELGSPDDELLRGVLVKQFADRQLAIDDAIISYMLTRMPRSLAAARQLVKDIDQQALEQKAEITRPFVARVLGRFAAPDMLGDDS